MSKNELVTKFVWDNADDRKVDLTRKNIISLNNDINNLGKNTVVGKTIANEFNTAGRAADQFKNKVNNSLKTPQDNELKKALQDIKRIQSENLQNEKLITKAINAESKLQADTKIREIRRADAEARRSANETLRILNKPDTTNPVGGLGVPLGVGAVVVGVSKFIDLSQQAIEKSKVSIQSNRLLTASATEAGLAYDVLAEKNKKFADSVGLSTVAASETTAKFTQLATTAGRTDQIDLIQKRFADLGGARGLDASKLQTIANQILSGSDEGLNSLGLPNPSVLYKQFAQSVGRSVESLTDLEQTQIRLDAVLKKGAIFDGTAELRMKSLDGQIAQTSASWDNLTTGVSNSITSSLEFRDAIKSVADSLKSVSVNTDEVRGKLKKGFTPEQIAAEQTGGADSFILSALRNLPVSKFNLGNPSEFLTSYQNSPLTRLILKTAALLIN